MEEINIDQVLGATYSDAEVFAVRYGYQYRKEAEKYANEGIGFHNCLEEASAVLLWIASAVLSGVTYDLIKKYAAQLWEKLMRMKVSIPENVNKVLLDEDELRRFVTYVDEFNSKELKATEKEIAYIREEVFADYIGKAAGDIWKREGRQPNHEEYMKMTREGIQFTDELLKTPFPSSH